MHKNIREELLKEAAKYGKYRKHPHSQDSSSGVDQIGYKHARGIGKGDRTAFFTPHRNWGEKRDQRPEILFKYAMTGIEGPRNDPDVWRWDGYVVLSEDHWPILGWDIPTTISSQERGWYLELLHRENTRLRPYDILQRMPSVAWNGKKLGNCLAMRRARFRLDAGLKAWSNRSKNTAAMDMLDEIVGPECIRENSTRYKGRDLNPEEIARYRSVGKGKNPERIRNSKPYKAELVKIKRESEEYKKASSKKDKENLSDSDDNDWEGFEESGPPTSSCPSRQTSLARYASRPHPGTMNPFDPHSPRRPSPALFAGSAACFAPKRQSLSRHSSRRGADYKKRRVVSAPEQRRYLMLNSRGQVHSGPFQGFTGQSAPTREHTEAFPSAHPFTNSLTPSKAQVVPDQFGESSYNTSGTTNSWLNNTQLSHHARPPRTPDTSFNDSSMLDYSGHFNPSRPLLPLSRRVVSAPETDAHAASAPTQSPRRDHPAQLRNFTVIAPWTAGQKSIIASFIRNAGQDFRHMTGRNHRPTDPNKSYHEQMNDMEQQLDVLTAQGKIRPEAVIEGLTRVKAWLGGFPGPGGVIR